MCQHFYRCICFSLAGLFAIAAWSAEPVSIRVADDDADLDAETSVFAEVVDGQLHRQIAFQEQPLRVTPRMQPAPTPVPSAAAELAASLFGGGLLSQSLLSADRRTLAVGVGTDVVTGQEATTRSATDAGDLLGKSTAALGLGTQRRTPIVTDPRVRGNRVGRLAGSGSYWVPARLDLDTTLSKIDARLLSSMLTIKGPYAARYGPGFSHVDFELLDSPRYDCGGFHSHGATSFDYKSNGQQWYGRQALWGGADAWGFRVGYGHRTGNDYETGAGVGIPSSYNSREVDAAFGADLTPDRHVEFHGLRLDQTGVEFPGQAFDIDWLGTDGYDLKYIDEDAPYCDRLGLDVWYNRTRFDGSAQRLGKRRQFPFYNFISFEGYTGVDSLSAGFRLAATWGQPDEPQLTLGTDLRYLRQRLDEITSGRILINIWTQANSPIPKSESTNPGLFLEYTAPLGDRFKITGGARVDAAQADVIDDPAKLASLGTASTPALPISLADILGSAAFQRTYGLGAAYLTGQYQINPCWTAEIATGYAERPPSLTEMYAAQTFMFVLQNGLNTVTGDPRLNKERLLQIDCGLKYDDGPLRGRIGGFHAWAWDYITFENLGIVRGPPNGQVEQVQLKYVNTELATFVGAEAAGEWDLTGWLTPFASLSYIDGRDRTRTGFFATKQATPGSPSTRAYGLPRGGFSGVAGAGEEPLPSISPLESRTGFRLHPATDASAWGLELAARIVSRQERVATSLLETPTPGFAVWDVRGYWRPREHLLVLAGVENFTNRTYREHLDFRSENGIQVFQPGINFYAGSELRY